MAKKIFYIGAFAILGALFQFLLHAGIEMWYITLLLRDFDVYGLGLTWDQWVYIHDSGAVLLLIAGIGTGYYEGRYWFARMYDVKLVERADRPDMARHFFELTAVEAKKSTCLRAHCGSVVVGGGHVIGRGHNSPPQDREDRRTCHDRKSTGKAGYDRTCCVHAEWRAIMDALRKDPRAIADSRLYFARVDADGNMVRSGKPYCTVCSRLALDSGIGEFALWHDVGITIYKTSEYDALSYAYSEEHKDEGYAPPRSPMSAIVNMLDAQEKRSAPPLGVLEEKITMNGALPAGRTQKEGEPPDGLPIS
ncbi:MAG: hypothetical protein A3I44_06255 [Candidatus Sungbacteria bacterium RIFCSPLOWO2_02_FULL_51_17]|uniref:CMP/dCMP-type deaminase domain-containing protein n=1 Tax=Candidatus Sungbacteria bacterium RIFCSPHIGHO2_02_FULL_51_29 TaxID=1802273 RepID=A0A1G2KQC8_9BACT|nr:MAG: hypothetical protein A2676_04570 [Candidatus Sungbacteria bacterium RIFCSPHIGHO2_01_FULL_51_22]OHA01626.1 MAG: hypothetical protein A3C16_02630 [Candidatus Sungbacteria bacterium RIFCSPHIGHO2_02_FULL_51_29]OHA06439.1 MAG: hypothetical protein A3B29_04720 [Candidatus Sungbacteria bacterium RIFCSPLOWO2_01_FULL_51_34]OHA10377.1 MAG: hypothetical protein A3I44_06255 [Candidatus Sungbacteria bacterium RIFCSPLOWO2_02_FULL_51_17]